MVVLSSTLFWIVGITNTVNLIDGLDGLAAGISAISASVLVYVALINGWTDTAVLTAVVAGACIGFLPYNFNPAQIFMGDGGAFATGLHPIHYFCNGYLKECNCPYHSGASFSLRCTDI